MEDQDKTIDGPGREVEGGGQSSGLPAKGQVDVGRKEPFERSGQRHWKEATVTDPNLDSRDNIFFAAVEMTRMPMVLTSARQPDNPIVFVNRAFLDLTGYEEEEVLGRNCRFLQGAQTDRETAAELGRAIGEPRAIAVEILNYKRDGTPFWNAVFVGPVFDADGQLLYFFASQMDVTRRKTTEQSLRQAQKMEAIGQLTAGLAHDFNNLLQVVSGNLELLRATPSPERAARCVENAAQATERAARLTRQLLAFARKTRLEPKPVDLSAMVSDIQEMMESTLGGRAELHLSLRRRLPPAMVDPTHLEMALINLLINARDASQPGGVITVATGPLKTPPEARGLPPGDYVVLCVQDEGAGMAPHIIERAAEPFFTTKAPDKGTGLGLAMVSGFVQQSRGRLEIDSELGRGTVVRLILPVHAGAAQEAASFMPAVAPTPECAGAHILVVEDSPEVLELAAENLRNLGYFVTTAANAEEALHAFEAAPPDRPVQLLFTDIIMPGSLNGIALAEEIRRRTPEVHVLLATGYNEELVDAPARRGLDVLGKPYRQTELADRIRQALNADPERDRHAPGPYLQA